MATENPGGQPQPRPANGNRRQPNGQAAKAAAAKKAGQARRPRGGNGQQQKGSITPIKPDPRQELMERLDAALKEAEAAKAERDRLAAEAAKNGPPAPVVDPRVQHMLDIGLTECIACGKPLASAASSADSRSNAANKAWATRRANDERRIQEEAAKMVAAQRAAEGK